MKMIEMERAVEWLIANSGDYFNARGKFSPEMIYDFRTAMDGQSEKPNNHLEGLDEAAEEFAKCYHDGMAVRAGFKAGAKWTADQGVTFTAPVDYDNGFYLDSSEQEEEAINKLGLKVMDWAVVQIRKKN